MKTGAIILAAGKGTRMKSALPKVLHQICGKAMVQIILDNIQAANIGKSYIVIGHGAEKVKEVLGNEHQYAVQEPQLGTGHCVMQAIPQIPDDTDGVLVVCGDTPLLKSETLKMLKDNFEIYGEINYRFKNGLYTDLYFEFKDGEKIAIDYIDDICNDISEVKKERLKDIFIKSSLYEMEFWNMANK